MQQTIERKLRERFLPTHVEVINESYMHSVPKGAETHFKVVIVSEQFDGVSLLQRHREVNNVLQDELKNGVHALSITAKTSLQWESSQHQIHESPACLGGMAKEKQMKGNH